MFSLWITFTLGALTLVFYVVWKRMGDLEPKQNRFRNFERIILIYFDEIHAYPNCYDYYCVKNIINKISDH